MDFPKLYTTPPIFRCEQDPQNILKIKEIPRQNIASRLMNRQIWGGFSSRVGSERYVQRSMYQSICPNFTVTHVEKPPCFLRKFTPDGKLFVAFSQDQMSVEVYYFQGPEAANHLFVDMMTCWAWDKKVLHGPPPEKKRLWLHQKDYYQPLRTRNDTYAKGWTDVISGDDKDMMSQEVRKKIFDCFFKLKFRVRVAPQGEDLNRECSLFTEDGRYLIVGSATLFNQNEFNLNPSSVSPEVLHRNNEMVEPNPRFPLEDYSIHILDLKHGALTDTKTFKSDRIFLSHNQGLYLYGNTLAVLSVQHQTISIFHVDNGQFWPIRTIGRFCYEDDELLYCSVPSFANVPAKDEAFFCTLKHRVLAYLFRNAVDRAYSEEGPQDLEDIARLRQYYDIIVKLRIWKMQLLDEDHLLLKYSNEDVVTLRASEPNSQHCFFVIYNISKTQVLAVFENTTESIVDFFENFTDSFRNNLTPEGRYISSPSNNMYSRQIHQKFRHTITSAKFGGPVEATKRILAQLPISSQSYSASPYLDQALFSYDDHRVSAMERPKACGEIPIRFYGRDSGIFKFQVHAGILAKVSQSNQAHRRLVAFTFHPTAPFAISVQRANEREYLVHFHIRLDVPSLIPLRNRVGYS